MTDPKRGDMAQMDEPNEGEPPYLKFLAIFVFSTALVILVYAALYLLRRLWLEGGVM